MVAQNDEMVLDDSGMFRWAMVGVVLIMGTQSAAEYGMIDTAIANWVMWLAFGLFAVYCISVAIFCYMFFAYVTLTEGWDDAN